ncbi:Hypothetical protein LEPBI_I0048 [Leptospira biflexa serovar Patoc strain 'Patoc 1 (Paris)']|uniref:Uncharacterized protein n=1 Tax=Leptospira biflexa serovar Patoc (strain Patoc 1 / ATCC 23582 / Paris) TaxID=456481 RepID=B0SK52_LEPBP|nr:Hypothetical protein LEPBI_I0048 [Leptospira biflexa serovar Patoc strain 'Patoc 1 (Paris)']
MYNTKPNLFCIIRCCRIKVLVGKQGAFIRSFLPGLYTYCNYLHNYFFGLYLLYNYQIIDISANIRIAIIDYKLLQI